MMPEGDEVNRALMRRSYSDACRERMQRLVMQDPVGADRAVRTETRHEQAFAKHLEGHDERGKEDCKTQSGHALDNS